MLIFRLNLVKTLIIQKISHVSLRMCMCALPVGASDTITNNSTAVVPSCVLIHCNSISIFSSFYNLLITLPFQDFSPMRAIICSYTVQAMAAIMVLLRDRGTAPLKKPWSPCSM